MENKKTISVWLILNDGGKKGKAALQRRSVGSQAFHFVCQATWAGKVEENEEIKTAVERECREELGNKFCENFDFSELKLFSKNNFIIKGKEWVCYNYSARYRSNLLKTVKLHREAFSDFIFVGKNDKFYSVKSGKNPENNIVLFDDQYKILKQILNGNKRNNKPACSGR